MRPKETSRMVVATLKPSRIQSSRLVCPLASGFTWSPRKMAGREMIRIVPLMAAIKMPNVVLDSAIHL